MSLSFPTHQSYQHWPPPLCKGIKGACDLDSSGLISFEKVRKILPYFKETLYRITFQRIKIVLLPPLEASSVGALIIQRKERGVTNQ
jgi:hypothetical protein